MLETWIDVSSHNGTIDWKRVKAAGIAGAVIRAGYGDCAAQKDARWDANIAGALAAGLKAAAYWFGYATSDEDARAEWAVCREILSPYRGRLEFAAYDYEYDSVRYYRQTVGRSPDGGTVSGIADAFLAEAKADGFRVMLYTNNDFRKNVFSAAVLAKYPLWLADYSGGPDALCAMQQTSGSGRVDGIAGAADLDTLFTEASPDYVCDTTGTVEIARGAAYQAEIVCGHSPTVAAGTPDVVTILPRSADGNRRYFYIVPIGQPGQETGVYINGGPKQFAVRIGGV